MVAENKPQKPPIQATDTGQIYLPNFGPSDKTKSDTNNSQQEPTTSIIKPDESLGTKFSLGKVDIDKLNTALESYPDEDLKLEQTGHPTLITQTFKVGEESTTGFFSRRQIQDEVNRRNNPDDINRQAELEESKIDGFTDESIIDGFKFLYSLYRGRTKKKIDTKRKIKFSTEDGRGIGLEISLPELRRLWFDKLVSRGSEIFDQQQLALDRTEEKQNLTEKLRSTVLDLECLDHMSIDPIWSSGNGNYDAFKTIIANRYNRRREVLDQARESRESFFGKNNVPVWMENSIISCRVKKSI